VASASRPRQYIVATEPIRPDCRARFAASGGSPDHAGTPSPAPPDPAAPAYRLRTGRVRNDRRSPDPDVLVDRAPAASPVPGTRTVSCRARPARAHGRPRDARIAECAGPGCRRARPARCRRSGTRPQCGIIERLGKALVWSVSQPIGQQAQPAIQTLIAQLRVAQLRGDWTHTLSAHTVHARIGSQPGSQRKMCRIMRGVD